MDDKCIMEGLLLDAKGVCDLYMHGAIESSTQKVRQTFANAFDNFHNIHFRALFILRESVLLLMPSFLHI